MEALSTVVCGFEDQPVRLLEDLIDRKSRLRGDSVDLGGRWTGPLDIRGVCCLLLCSAPVFPYFDLAEKSLRFKLDA